MLSVAFSELNSDSRPIADTELNNKKTILSNEFLIILWWNSQAKVTFSLALYHKVKRTISGNIWSTHFEILSSEDANRFELLKKELIYRSLKNPVQNYLEEVGNDSYSNNRIQEVTL